MNYFLINYAYGRQSIEKISSLMDNTTIILSKKNNGTWLKKVSNTPIWHRHNHIESIIYDEDNNIINWGNHIFSDDVFFKLNKPSRVALASNKKESRKILQECGIKVPFTVFNINEATFPFIARPSYHSKGKFFYIIKNEIDKNMLMEFDLHGYYFSSIFPKQEEYRIHCAHGKVLYINKKPIVEGELRANQAITEESWKYISWENYRKDLCKEALIAIKVLELDYGAVDIMVDGNNFAICEINTSPTINTSEYGSKRYALYFDYIINNNFPEHKDFSIWNSGKSFAWKNEQLNNI